MREMKLPPESGPPPDIADSLRAHVEATRAPLRAAEPGPARAHADEPLGPPEGRSAPAATLRGRSVEVADVPPVQRMDHVVDLAAVERRARARIRLAVSALREERLTSRHRTGTGPAYRQEGEINALDLVLTYLDHDTFTPGEPSITCPRCQRTSYNPHDVRHAYCGSCGYHDQMES